MDDITIPGAQNGDSFKIKQMMRDEPPAHEKQAREPDDKVKVKFQKFVQLVATHDFADVMSRYADEDIVLSTNLLTDLANAHEEVELHGNKIPLWIVIGVLIGVVLTYLIIRF
ncbi:hypothetical protein CO046_02320 [Candidatus Peregrinibacteria bacterium CG_4_9_14_0_2_um_filter_53_11]|nr:MAG: hypothetical protein CO046_02320 [Candidatus Peregrinibacteria bacterium CG_4_9_14_0_2_um_filter_53_11]